MTDDSKPSPPGYQLAIDRMVEGARVWMAQHPFAELKFRNFEPDFAREHGINLKPGETIAIAAALPNVIDRWAANADTRAFLHALDEASQREATYMQARALVQQMTERHIERSQGQMDAGNWACSGCGVVLDGFTSMDGPGKKPNPGAYSVCINCAVIQQVNAAGTGFQSVSTRNFNQLPKSFRQDLLKLTKHVKEMIAKRKARS